MYKEEEYKHLYRNGMNCISSGYGIKQELVHEDYKLLSSEFICGICMNLVNDPEECSYCYQLFCKPCILKWLSSSDDDKCPNRCIKFENKMNQKLKNLLNSIKLRCYNKNIGCTDIINYENFTKHLKECNFSILECNECEYKGYKNDIIQHVKECRYMYFRCEFCNEHFQKIIYNDHINTCIIRQNIQISVLNDEDNYVTSYQEHKLYFIEDLKNKLQNNPETIKSANFTNKQFLLNEYNNRKTLEEMILYFNGFNEYYYNNESENFNFYRHTIKPILSKFHSLKTSGVVNYNENVIGTNDVYDLNTNRRDTGPCSASPGNIIIELKNFYHFNEIEIAGYKCSLGNGFWNHQNGSCSLIFVSHDGNIWKEVGILPYDFNSRIIKVRLLRSFSKYIRFTNETAIGISYLNILPLNFNYVDDRLPLWGDFTFSGEYVDSVNNEVYGSNLISNINGSEKESFFSKPKGYLLIQLRFPKSLKCIQISSPSRNVRYSKDVFISLTGNKDDWTLIGSYEDRCKYKIENKTIKCVKIVNSRNKDPLGVSFIEIN